MNVTLKTLEHLNGYDQDCVQFYLEINAGGETHTVNVLSVPKSYYRAQIAANWTQARESVWPALCWQQKWLRQQGLDHWDVWQAYQD